MLYMCLIYASGDHDPQPGTPEFGALMQAYMEFSEKVQTEGKMVSGEALKHVSTATTVAVRDGKTEITDGPFAETKEQLGGYYILDCADLDEALAYAALIPSATYGRVEVRPVERFDD